MIICYYAKNDKIHQKSEIKIFYNSALDSVVNIPFPPIGDNTNLNDVKIHNNKIYFFGIVEYLLPANLRLDKVYQFGFFQVRSLDGTLLQSKIISTGNHYAYLPDKILEVNDSYVTVLARERTYLPIFGDKVNMVICKIPLD